jgi:hypothetical protein
VQPARKSTEFNGSTEIEEQSTNSKQKSTVGNVILSVVLFVWIHKESHLK